MTNKGMFTRSELVTPCLAFGMWRRLRPGRFLVAAVGWLTTAAATLKMRVEKVKGLK